ncbi:MAG: Rieske 2Fe-2S domain-containing protein, partial [Candidatus Acidiferrales bacterium]
MTDSGDSRTGARSSDMLWGFWYPALRSEQVRHHRLVRAMLLDAPLVLGRDAAGKPFALRDVCP